MNNNVDAWEKYTGVYEPVFYDLKLKNGRLVSHCWPQEGNYHPVDSSGEAYIEGYRIDSIRKCERQWD